MRPSAKKFFERSGVAWLHAEPLVASSVIDVIGDLKTRYADSEPSSSGFAS